MKYTDFTPYWLHRLSKEEREDVVDWLAKHDVDPNLCAEFTIESFGNSYEVTCKMYTRHEDGGGLVMRNGEPLYDEPKKFRVFGAPDPIKRAVDSPHITAQ